MNISKLVKISVIIPTYNRKLYVKLAIDSVLMNKSDLDYILNIVVVDDGSTDNTDQYLTDYIDQKHIHFFKIKNSERGFARNFGARFAIDSLGTDYLYFFDADDLLCKGAISTFNKNIQQFPEIKCFFAQCQILSSQNQLLQIHPKVQWPLDVRSYVINNQPLLPLGCTILHKDLFNQIGGFSEDRNLSGTEDWFFLLEIILNHKVQFIEFITTHYRRHEGNTNLVRFDHSMNLALQKMTLNEKKLNLTEQEIKALKIQFRYNQIGVHNCDIVGQPFMLLVDLVKEFPAQMLKLKLYYYSLSILKINLVRFFTRRKINL